MAAYGYRPRGDHQHRPSIEFRPDRPAGSKPGCWTAWIAFVSERNRTVYDVAGQTTQEEMEDALSLANDPIPILKAAALRELRG